MEEHLFRVVVYECGRPTHVFFTGTEEECDIMAQAWCIQHKNSPYYRYCDVGIDAVRYDDEGKPISFAEERDEYDHCAEMGDFDY